MSNTRKIRLIIDKTKTSNKHGRKGCGCGRSAEIVEDKNINTNKIPEFEKKTIHNINKLKLL